MRDRFLYVVVGSLITYAFVEMTIEYAREQREKWSSWYASFTAPFVRNPGRREFLREALMREEMTTRHIGVSTDAD